MTRERGRGADLARWLAMAAGAGLVSSAALAADVPGDATTRAALPINRTVEGLFEAEGDADWYRVTLEAGRNYGFKVVVDGASGASFAFVQLRDASGRLLEARFASEDPEVAGGFDFRPSRRGTYFLAVRGDSARSYTASYTLDTPAEPPTRATLAIDGTRAGAFLTEWDVDAYAVRLERGRVYDFAVLGDTPGTAADVLDGQGRIVATSSFLDVPLSDSFDEADTLIEDFRAPYTGPFFVRAFTTDEFSGPYTVAVRLDRSFTPYVPGAPPTNGNDLLIGAGAADRVEALAGDDPVQGEGGNDDLRGGEGQDSLLGGPGNDAINGGPDRDVLYGEAGDDRIGTSLGLDEAIGGPGSDTFEFAAGYGISSAGFSGLSILDFAKGQDRLDLSRIDADIARPGNQAFSFIGTAAFTGAGQLRYFYDEAVNRTIVVGRVDGSGSSPDFDINFEGRVAPSASDFRL